MTTDITPCVQRDTPAVLALLAISGLPTADVDDNLLTGFLVARGEGGEPVGVVGLEAYGPHGLLRSLAVAPAIRETGLGRRLVAAAEERARSCGVKELYLLTTTAPDFFRRLGWQEDERTNVPPAIAATSEFSSVCPDSAVMFRRPLDPSS